MEFGHRFGEIFVTSMSPMDAVYNAGWCIAFLGFWRLITVEGNWDHLIGDKPTLKGSFLTVETFKDALIALNNVVLIVVYHATKADCSEYKVCFDRISSRFNEYANQFFRAYTKTSTSI